MELRNGNDFDVQKSSNLEILFSFPDQPKRVMFTKQRNLFTPIGPVRRARYRQLTVQDFAEKVGAVQPNVLIARYATDPLDADVPVRPGGQSTAPSSTPVTGRGTSTARSATPPSPISAREPPVAVPPGVRAPIVPPTIRELVDVFSLEKVDQDTEHFISWLHERYGGNSSELQTIETLTRSQQPGIWIELRKDRITASMLYDVFTRMNTIEKKDGPENIDLCPLFRKIAGYESYKTKDMLYGNLHEPDALKDYVQGMESKGHRLTVTKSGLVVTSDLGVLGASPDGLIKCDCCGDGVLEIKCPPTLKDKVPGPDNIGFFKNGTLNTRHKYYGQLLTNMALTGRSWCDLAVWSPMGMHVERIQFDLEAWDGMKKQVLKFYINHYGPNVLFGAIDLEPKGKGKGKGQKQKASKKSNPRSFPKCPQCDGECTSNPNSFGDQSMKCEACGKYYHFACADFVTADDVPLYEWVCAACRSAAAGGSKVLRIK